MTTPPDQLDDGRHLYEVLDAAAEAAMTGRRLDPVAVLAGAGVTRRRLRRRRVARWTAGAGLLAAAAAAVVAVPLLAPVTGPAVLRGLGGVAPSAPALGPTGMPQRWGTPPEWTPLVTGRPIEAASVLLSAVVRPAVEEPGGVWRVPGTVVVSADGRDYRSLPSVATTENTALSPDGRLVAWWESPTEPGASGPLLVRVLRLADGRLDSVAISGANPYGYGGQIRQLLWSPDGHRLLAVGEGYRQAGSAGRLDPDPGVWSIGVRDGRVDGEASRLCACRGNPVLAFAREGGLRQGGTGPDLVPGATRLPDAAAADGLARVVLSPDGTRWASVESAPTDQPVAQDLVVHGPGDRRTRVRVSGTTLREAGDTLREVLAWSDRGLLLAGGKGIWFTDPGLSHLTRISTGDGGPSRVAAVAADLAASGRTVPGSLPHFSHWDPAYLIDRWRLADPVNKVVGEAFLVALVVGPVLVLVRRARRTGPSGPRAR